MRLSFILGLVFLISFSLASAQERSQDDQPHIQPRNLPESEQPPQPPAPQGESASKDSQILSGAPPPRLSGANDDVHELRPYDPHKAAKDLEVGQFYLKRKNYRAALDRFNEALLYKPRDADATFYLAQTQEKLEFYAQAEQNYKSYLEIAPGGPFAKEVQDALKRIGQRSRAGVTIQSQPEDVRGIVAEGEAFLGKNDFESAHAAFVRALQTTPDDPIANFRLGESLQGLQRLDEARIFYKKYLALQPNGKLAAEARRQVAEINLVLGKP
jgi:tetratricopeptide (TPR) repeat protein